MAETFTACPLYHRPVDPEAPGDVYAVEQVDLAGMGQAQDFADGMGGFFHPECPPERVGYARRPRPDK
jgi:hypothetical protein